MGESLKGWDSIEKSDEFPEDAYCCFGGWNFCIWSWGIIFTRIIKTILRFKCAKKVVLAAIIQRWLMCKSGCVAAYMLRPPVTIIVCPDT